MVIGAVSGTLNDSVIRKTELVLSLRDTCFWCMARIHGEMTPIDQDPVLWGNELLEWDLLTILDRWNHHCGMVQKGIVGIWRDRFNLLAQLPLESFVLDMTETFSVDQHYIALETAREFQRFRYGIAAKFTIKAPTTELAKEIMDLIRRKNTEEPSQTAANPGGW